MSFVSLHIIDDVPDTKIYPADGPVWRACEHWRTPEGAEGKFSQLLAQIVHSRGQL